MAFAEPNELHHVKTENNQLRHQNYQLHQDLNSTKNELRESYRKANQLQSANAGLYQNLTSKESALNAEVQKRLGAENAFREAHDRLRRLDDIVDLRVFGDAPAGEAGDRKMALRDVDKKLCAIEQVILEMAREVKTIGVRLENVTQKSNGVRDEY
ncbi:uncharacterized protein GIQ15_03614 [Arthroderma uncinatum]|uniref:uncharacterized protein n=1 Tax=Arthroderma uncinatum TaxID=74035 RepID=UPI00144ADCA2|nr:uncharacterized protein GIQ15_03614 [Arthroderma uncinatum]KAF3484290.1 hypothetical protein GIQ15_03614 [Arthroderma uncinatum]